MQIGEKGDKDMTCIIKKIDLIKHLHNDLFPTTIPPIFAIR